MKTITFLAVVLSGSIAMASPTVTNQDEQPYTLSLDCKQLSHGWTISPDQTIALDEYRVASSCQVSIYPADNPFGKDGDYDKKKLISSAKLKKDSECVIRKRRLVCE
jgi:hypothetical protein